MSTVVIKEVSPQKLRSLPEYDEHEKVISFDDQSTGLRGFIAIHRTRGIFGTGGTRYFSYTKEDDALSDALRLSHAMTAKCVVSGLPYGGAKGVIMAKHFEPKSEEFLAAYAHVVTSLEGKFRTGEDVGMTEADVQILFKHGPYFNGKTGVAGDPSPYAGLSVFQIMKSAAKAHLRKDHLSGLTVAVKGLGKVGSALVDHLIASGARVVGADIDTTATMRIKEKHPGVSLVDPAEIPFITCDIYAPCAMGGEITPQNVGQFQTKIICGGANNILTHQSLANSLLSRNILYVPDFLANAGGVINVSDELEKDGYQRERVLLRINHLSTLFDELYAKTAQGISLSEATEQYVAEQLL